MLCLLWSSKQYAVDQFIHVFKVLGRQFISEKPKLLFKPFVNIPIQNTSYNTISSKKLKAININNNWQHSLPTNIYFLFSHIPSIHTFQLPNQNTVKYSFRCQLHTIWIYNKVVKLWIFKLKQRQLYSQSRMSNSIQNSQMNIHDQPKIRVVIRKRPLNKKQLLKNEQDVVEVTNGADVKVRQHKLKVDLTKYIEQHMFKFDSAFGEHTNNQQLYQQCVKPIVQCAFLGAKVTCFAYGQTGSGKTYTMNGDLENNSPGMYYLGAQDIFNLRDSYYPHLTVSVSFFEIYCGKLFDLLNNRQQLQAREDGKQNVNIIGLSIKNISSISQFMQMIAHGSSVRITSQNSTNADSSRSHAILQISLLNAKKLYGKISFIDLAGCQRGADTMDQNKQTKIDGAQINKSLLALKQCIRALDQGKNHTPFRGSKLTMVLKDSFTGFCRTLMIGNVSPGSGSCENTLNTLRYADRVKQLKKGGSSSQLTKQEQQARQLMLPRSQKNKQIIIKNEDDSDQQIIISSPNMSSVIQQKNLNAQPKPAQQAISQPAPQKKMKYIQKAAEDQSQQEQFKRRANNTDACQGIVGDRFKNQRKGVMNMMNNNQNQNQNHNPRSVSHTNGADKIQQNSRIRDQRNKSVFNKVEAAVQKSTFAQLKKQIKEPNTERNSFNQNYSLANLHEKFREVVGQSNKMKSGNVQNAQINLVNRYGKKNNEKVINALNKVKSQCNEQNVPTFQDTNQNKEWQRILKKFRSWKPNRNQFQQMSVLFQELVKLIMAQELQITESHKKILISEQKMLKDSLSLYNEVQRQSKNNQQMMDYTERLNRHLSQRMKILGQLKQKTELYQYHLRQHENCEAKLIEASQTPIWNPGNIGHLENSDIGLWNQ